MKKPFARNNHLLRKHTTFYKWKNLFREKTCLGNDLEEKTFSLKKAFFIKEDFLSNEETSFRTKKNPLGKTITEKKIWNQKKNV